MAAGGGGGTLPRQPGGTQTADENVAQPQTPQNSSLPHHRDELRGEHQGYEPAPENRGVYLFDRGRGSAVEEPPVFPDSEFEGDSRLQPAAAVRNPHPEQSR
mmetsp:Transcript_328/g.370  ORF Transcript_328/g.370 Transcript_328/m.370 type:complete len:102 (+) Transcript_328:1052-1357(+)